MTESAGPLTALIRSWIVSRVDSAALAWVDDRTRAVKSGDKKLLFIAFGLVPRKVGKADLALTESEREAAESVRSGWNPSQWSLDQLVRTYFVLNFPVQDVDAYVKTLDLMFSTGEVGELVALYQVLPLLPNPSAHVLRAAEGIRNNIKAVFCAVAQNNPFPSEQFSDDQWNQLILKCLFIGVSLRSVVGVDERANAPLMSMLVDFAHERRAAHRPIPAELWRCVGPYADDRALDDLRITLTSNSPAGQQAAALALSVSPHPLAKSILAAAPDLAAAINAGEFSWRTVAAAEQAL
ncbi:MAG: EboA domain-containing protein [Planctomycetes bacterium]|nr:EboA domain-containing protein [Planctomycetota bacterium]